MSETHLHLMINHFPLMGSAIAIVLVIWALAARSRDLTRAALILTLVCGAGAYLAHWSGEGAEEQVEDLPWAERELIHEHEEAADWSLWLLGAAGLVSAVGLVRMRKGADARVETMIVLGLVLFGFAATVKTALDGGKIRHEEVRPGFVFPAGGSDH
jgi:hypothetical protein